MVRNASRSPRTVAFPPSLNPRSIDFSAASGANSAITSRASVARSTSAAGRSAASTPGSVRASVSNCSESRVARSRPDLRSESALRRSASVGARSASCACRCTAVNGVRNSCAASAMNVRCMASALPRLSSRPLSARTSGCTSPGRPRSASGSSCVGERRPTAAATRSSGSSPRAMMNQMRSPSAGSTASNGTIVRSAMLAASSRRARIGCATCTTWFPVNALNTRHSPDSVRKLVNPSCACWGSTRCGCER